MNGRVAEFDDDKGYGYVEGADGRRLFFHCTAIVGGTRTIETGTDVDYAVTAGHMGRWEARRISPRADPPALRP